MLKDILEKLSGNLTDSDRVELGYYASRLEDNLNFVEKFVKPFSSVFDSKAIALPFEKINAGSDVFEDSKSTITIEVPSIYKHLFFFFSGRCTGSTYYENLKGRFNGDTGNNYDTQYIAGVNATTGAAQAKAGSSFDFGTFAGASASAGAIGSFFSFIPHIQSSNWKSILVLGGEPQYTATDMIAALDAAFYRSTLPISSITIFAPTSTMAAGSTISLYGVR